MHYEDALDTIVKDIKQAAGPDLHDWVDGPGEYHEGLGHCDSEERDNSLFNIDISISTEFMSEGEVEALDARMNSVSDQHEIAVDLVEGNDTHCVYRFSCHAKFLQYPAPYA